MLQFFKGSGISSRLKCWFFQQLDAFNRSERSRRPIGFRNKVLTARARLGIRRTPYFAKIAKGLRLGYYRGSVAGSWIARCYRGAGVYATEALGIADDTLDADGSTGRRRSTRGAGANVST